MLPIIFHIGPVPVYAYGLMLAAAVVVCAFLLSRDAREKGLAADFVFDLVFWTVIGGIAGARVFFIILNLDFFIQYPLEVVMVQHGGLAFQGGLVGGTAAAVLFITKKGQQVLTVFDLMAPYLALGHAIGRIGCFLNGCCYGLPAAWGIYFPVHHEHLIPTQLFAAGELLLVFFILKWLQGVFKKPGQVFAFYLILSALQRFLNEFLRGDHTATYFGLSVFQVVSAVVLATGLIMLAKVSAPSRGK